MLALFGGRPAVPPELERPYPPIGDEERTQVGTVLDTGVLWGPWAPKTRELETAWAARMGVRHCAALNSGTAGLHVALAAAGIGFGHEVIVPAYGFVATAACVLMVGAVPRFVDVDDDGNLDPEGIEAVVNERTAAIVAAHLHGLSARLDGIVAAAERHNLRLIEDCAQAHGADYRGRKVGSIGDAGVFSLNATKPLAGPEGGLLTTNDDGLFNAAARLRVFGSEWSEGGVRYRDADTLGYNFRINELVAAFTLARLRAFDMEAKSRIENARTLAKGLANFRGVTLQEDRDDRTHIRSMFRIRLCPRELGIDAPVAKFREQVAHALAAEGACFWIWEHKPLPEYRVFLTKNAAGRGFPWVAADWSRAIKYSSDDFPKARALAEDALFTTAHFPPNDSALMEAYATAFAKVWNHLDEVVRIEVPSAPPGYQEPF